MKVVINKCFGGFGLSEKAMRRYSEIKYGKDMVVSNGDTGVFKSLSILDTYEYDISRDDPVLVQVVEELGAEANGDFAKLVIKEIPDGSEWEIEEYDGQERLREPARYY